MFKFSLSVMFFLNKFKSSLSSYRNYIDNNSNRLVWVVWYYSFDYPLRKQVDKTVQNKDKTTVSFQVNFGK